jgi:hypothetical protein
MNDCFEGEDAILAGGASRKTLYRLQKESDGISAVPIFQQKEAGL